MKLFSQIIYRDTKFHIQIYMKFNISVYYSWKNIGLLYLIYWGIEFNIAKLKTHIICFNALMKLFSQTGFTNNIQWYWISWRFVCEI